MAASPRQLVFGVFKGMGDLLWAVPVIRAELDRGVAVHLLLFPSAPLANFCSLLDLGELRDLLHLHSLPRGWRDVPRFVRELASLSPETVWISPHAPAAAASWKIPLCLSIMSRLVWHGAQLVGAASEPLSFLFNRSLLVDRSLPLRFREWTAYCLYRDGTLPPSPSAVSFLREISERRASAPLYDLVIHPGAMAKNRFWPATKYPALIEALPANWKIGVLGLAEDVAALKTLLPADRGIAYLVGTLMESLQTLASAELLLVMDSGNMHFAEVLGVPAVAIFGKEDPRAILASGLVEAVYEHSVPCQPCGRAVCTQREIYCLTNIDPLHVAKRLSDYRRKIDGGSAQGVVNQEPFGYTSLHGIRS